MSGYIGECEKHGRYARVRQQDVDICPLCLVNGREMMTKVELTDHMAHYILHRDKNDEGWVVASCGALDRMAKFWLMREEILHLLDRGADALNYQSVDDDAEAIDRLRGKIFGLTEIPLMEEVTSSAPFEEEDVRL